MKSLVFFNNKGGVGKTTLTCNVVSYLNIHKSKRVLLVDVDPQCNATQALLDDEICESLYLEDNGESKTLFDYLAPIESGDAEIHKNITPLIGSGNKYNTDLIPGHPSMSLVEDKLSTSWGELLAGTPSGFRTTNWVAQLMENLGDRYDLVVFDVGPSLGALNRTVILSSDYIVTPFGCDIFSILGIQNISSWISTWSKQYQRAIDNIREDRPDFLDEYPIHINLDKKFRFAGYSVQQYVTRSFKSGKRPVKAYDEIMKDIPVAVENYLLEYLVDSTNAAAEQFDLGNIPYLYSLVPLAQSERSPIHQLKSTSRLVGSQYQQVKKFDDLIDSICDKLLGNLGLNND